MGCEDIRQRWGKPSQKNVFRGVIAAERANVKIDEPEGQSHTTVVGTSPLIT